MANNFTYKYDRDTSSSEKNADAQSSSQTSMNSNFTRLTSQRQLSDSRSPTTCVVIFENASNINSDKISFLPYLGTRARNHHSHRLYLPQIDTNPNISSDQTKQEFTTCIKQVLESISPNDLSSYVVSVRTGITYFFSKRFLFKNKYTIGEIRDIIQKKIPTTDNQYYYQQRTNNSYQSDESLRSTFCNIKPINRLREFVEKLKENEFYVKEQKYVFKIYLQSEDKQTHVCTVDPALNYSIVELSKDFQRTSNIDFIRDRHESKFWRNKTYDDIFDFRIQFQYNPRTRSKQMKTIEYELRQQFPSLDQTFQNENILIPSNNNKNEDQEFHICEQLCPYIQFIRRDFGDVYQNNGDDLYFEYFNIYLESSVEYHIDRKQSICTRELDTHGLVYARLDLNTMVSSSTIDENLLIEKLWNMGGGLTFMASQCTTSETQQSTNYYTKEGDHYTAADEALVQTILKQPTLCSMLSLPNNAKRHDIKEKFDRINNQLNDKWNFIRCGPVACEKLNAFYQQFVNERN